MARKDTACHIKLTSCLVNIQDVCPCPPPRGLVPRASTLPVRCWGSRVGHEASLLSVSSPGYKLASKVMRKGEVYDVLPVVPGTKWATNPSYGLPGCAEGLETAVPLRLVWSGEVETDLANWVCTAQRRAQFPCCWLAKQECNYSLNTLPSIPA